MKAGGSYIFRAIGSFLFFIINVFALYLLLRGHNLPGGGFIGGLASALSLIMLSLAYGVERAQRILHIDPVRLAAVGLAIAVATALLPVLVGAPLLRHYHWKFEGVPLLGRLELGTPLIFDLGIFLVVVGVTAKMIFVLARSISGLTALEEKEWHRYAAELEEPVETEHSRASVRLADETEDETP
jgi:multicomponent Na+:H+ antiporter subunit B